MWLTYPLLRVAPAQAIVQTALHNGVTHLYVEVAGSRVGFYGGPGLATLLPVAHAHGIRVLAWVYPYLQNVAGDVEMTVEAARFTAPSGDHPDGIMADVEQNMTPGAVKGYSQIVRALLGPQELMGVATYPPQGSWGRLYPFAIVAASWNVIAPMDYWHVQRRTYTPAEAQAYVRNSILGVRAATGNPREPVEVIGQMYNPWQDGEHDATAGEIAAAAHEAQALGAVGIGFFEWNHATPAQWAALPGCWLQGPA